MNTLSIDEATGGLVTPYVRAVNELAGKLARERGTTAGACWTDALEKFRAEQPERAAQLACQHLALLDAFNAGGGAALRGLSAVERFDVEQLVKQQQAEERPATARKVAATPGTLEALAEKIQHEQFSADPEKFQAAWDEAKRRRPDLVREYLSR